MHHHHDYKTSKVLTGTSYVIPDNQKPMGAGTFGTVFRTYDLNRMTEDFAVKVVEKQKHDVSKEQGELIRREIEVIEHLPECLNLVRYEKYCLESTQRYYFIMEFCNGGDLHEQLVHRSMSSSTIYSEVEILDFLSQFLNGYRQLLNHNIIHRDVKPQNILIHNGIYKITDFGLSKLIKTNQEENTDITTNTQSFDLQFSIIPGTPMYQAPDVTRSPMYSEAIDVFSLGTILFQMLFVTANVAILRELASKGKNSEPNQHPLDIRNIYPLFTMHDVKDRQAFFSKVKNVNEEDSQAFLNNYITQSKVRRSEGLVNIMRKSLCVDPKQRITFNELFNHPLIKNRLEEMRIIEQPDIDKKRRAIKENSNQEFPVDLLGSLNSSEIINIEDIKDTLLKTSMSVCAELHREDNLPISQQYYRNKIIFYQHMLEEKNRANQSRRREKKPVNSAWDTNVLTQTSQEKLIISSNQIQAIIQAQERKMSEEQTAKEDEKLNTSLNQIGGLEASVFHEQEGQEGQEQKQPGSPHTVPHRSRLQSRCFGMHGVLFGGKSSDEAMFDTLNESIVASQLRVSQLDVTKKIEQVMLFLRECGMMFRRGAEQLSKGYPMMQLYDDRHRTNFVRLFDEVSLLSLLQYRNELRSFTRKIDTVLLDNSVGVQESGFHDRPFNEADFALFKISNEYTVLVDQLKLDRESLEKVFAANNRIEFDKLWQNYKKIAASQAIIKQDFADRIFMLIKKGVEEFGFLENSELRDFQTTLLFFTELQELARNPLVFYKKYNYSLSFLQLRCEQIALAQEHAGTQLALYCEHANISIIAISD